MYQSMSCCIVDTGDGHVVCCCLFVINFTLCFAVVVYSLCSILVSGFSYVDSILYV